MTRSMPRAGARRAALAHALIGALAAVTIVLDHPRSVQAQPATGRVAGAVVDALGRPLAQTAIALEAPDGSTIARTTTDAEGRFAFPNVAFGTYAVVADRAEFEPSTAIVTVSAAAPSAERRLALTAIRPLDFAVAARQLEEARNRLNPQTGSTVYTLDRRAIEELPQGANTPLNQVLLHTPGMAQDSFGQLHLRGDHANIQYRVDGIIIPESINLFGQTFDSRFANRVELLTGALPAQYGYRTAGVVDIQTKTGAYAPGGRAELYGGSYGTFQPSLEYGGGVGPWNYYVEGSFLQSNFGIEPPTAKKETFHDFTQQEKGFGYVSYLLNPTNRVSAFFGAAHSDFEIPNFPGPTPLAAPSFVFGTVSDFNPRNLDDRQYEQNYYGVVALQGTYGALDYQVAPFARYSSVRFRPDQVGDLVLFGSATDLRRNDLATGLQADGSWKVATDHTLRSGLFVQRERAIADQTSLVFPGDPAGGATSTTPIPIDDTNSKTGWLYGVYLQDEWKALQALTINYGLRFDLVDAFTHEDQISPRIGAVYKLTETTTIHAGYSRYFTPPPLELVSQTNTSRFAGTVLSTDPTIVNGNVRAERADYYDIGLSQKLTDALTVGIDAYYKWADNMLDEGQFTRAVLFTPFNYRHGIVRGAEFTASYNSDPVRAYFNFAAAKSIGKDIVSGQAFIDPAALAYIHDHYIHTDHDQTFTISGGASYNFASTGTRLSVDVISGSGLRQDGDVPNGSSLPTYWQVNLGAVQHLPDAWVPGLDLRLAVVNLFDEKIQLRSGNGVGVGAPQFAQRLGFFAGLSKSF